MSDVTEKTALHDEAWRLADELGDHGINIYVSQSSQPVGAFCGAVILFDFEETADRRFHVIAQIKGIRDRFYEDKAFRQAISHRCFQLGSYLQHWNEPTPNPNF